MTNIENHTIQTRDIVVNHLRSHRSFFRQCVPIEVQSLRCASQEQRIGVCAHRVLCR